MKVEYINEKDAPPVPSRKSQSADEAHAILNQLGKGKVALIVPDEGQTIRGLRVALGRAAKTSSVKPKTWEVDGVLYVKLAG